MEAQVRIEQPSRTAGKIIWAKGRDVHLSRRDDQAAHVQNQGLANPLGTILSLALMLRHSCGLENTARAVEFAVEATLDAGHRTRDIAAPGATFLHTDEMGDEVIRRIEL